jgi:hypothetical protein
MERIASLIDQLQQALQRNADASHMLMLTNMLRVELEQASQQKQETLGSKSVAVVMPAARVSQPAEMIAEPVVAPKLIPPVIVKIEEKPVEKIVEVLQVDEDELEAELEEIRQKAEFTQKIQVQQQQQHKPVLLFEDEPEIPTLIHQPNFNQPAKPVVSREVNDASTVMQLSLNDQLSEKKTELGHRFTESNAIRDLKKAIGINDRFVFINELFRGDEVMYERSIKTINNFSIYPEAQYWMERELKIKLGWDDSRPAAQEFYALVKRRFS